ncbi:rod shape-determining protein MreC [Halonatronum saccharophilum]|uniref:rod shape-determining protein MreC n=1 Tax=Halonatronum saccharophilum TaxID=150060 RepID=UPI000483A600|nr:rod shape-determining protein MreC [Halonatronum saccharophilum]
MLDFFKEHGKKVVIVIFVITLVIFINFVGEEKEYNKFEALIIDALRPGFVAINKARDLSQSAFRVVVNYSEVKNENNYLRNKVDRLSYRQNELEKIMLENERLRELLNFKRYTGYDVVGGRVLSYSVDNWSNIVMINVGARDGVENRMPVVTKGGYLVGTIKQVTRTTSQVLLLNDDDFVTGGLVQRTESRDLGIVRGRGRSKSLTMDNISWDADIKGGDIIVTSGLSERYPKGLPIAKVEAVRSENYGLTQRANLKPFVDLEKLEELLVIVGYKDYEEMLLLPAENSNLDFEEEE